MPEQTPVHPISASTKHSIRPVSALLNDTFRMLKIDLGTYVGIVAISAITGTVLTMIGVLSFGAGLKEVLVTREFTPAALPSLIGVLVGIVVVTLVYAWSQIALVYAITQHTSRIGVLAAYQQSFRKLPSYLWIGILSAICILVGAFFLIVPGIIVTIFISLSVYVFVVEGLRGRQALSRSTEYVRGHWWAVFGRLCLVYLLAFLLSAVVSAVTNVVPYLEAVGSIIVSLVVTPFVATYLYLIYKDLKAMKGAVV